LTNTTERSGTEASGTYAYAPLKRKWYYAIAPPSVRRAPPQVLGDASGLGLAALALVALILLPTKKRRRLLLLAAVDAPRLASAKVLRRQRARLNLRVTLPCLFWRFATGVLLVCLIGNDPSFDNLWTANAECVYPDNSSTDARRITTYKYDYDGHLTQVNSPEGVINYEYDLATGRHTRTCSTNTEVAYGYDELGRLKTVQLLKRNGTNLSSPETTTNAYTTVGNRWKVMLPNGIVTEYQYDSLNRLTNLTQKLGGTNLLANYGYQLHPTGRRTSAVEILRIPDTEGGGYLTNTLGWAYDQMYRLTNETSTSSSSAGSFTNRYAYDLVGNRFSKVRIVGSSTVTTTNLYNENDQLLKEVTWSGSTMTESNLYAYDNNGSLTTKAHTAGGSTTAVTYSYDLKNKMSSVTGGGSTTTFVYNDQGIRVRSTTGGSSTLFLIDANNHTGYQQILEELSARGVPASKSYVIGDDVLGQAVGSTVSWLLYDGHGSTRQLSSTAGAVTSRYNFEAYGTRLDSSTSEANELAHNSVTSLLYCGEQFDSTLKMYNLRARYYDTNNGRFDAMDSFKGSNFDPQSLHKYGYCNQEPVNALDPSGKLTLPELAIAIGAVVFLASFAWYTVVKKDNPLEAARKAVLAGALTALCIVLIPEIVAFLASAYVVYPVAATIGGLAFSAVLAYFAMQAWYHLQEVNEVLFGPNHTVAERAAALGELLAFVFMIAATAEAASPRSGAARDFNSIVAQQPETVAKVIDAAPEAGTPPKEYVIPYGEMRAAFIRLQDGEIFHEEAVEIGGHPGLAKRYGMLVSDFPPFKLNAVNQPAVFFSAINDTGLHVTILDSGAFADPIGRVDATPAINLFFKAGPKPDAK
jgi:RHS repeat-associated protein